MDGSPHSFAPIPALPAKRTSSGRFASQRNSPNNQSPSSIPSFASSRPNSFDTETRTTLQKSNKVSRAQDGIRRALIAFSSVVEQEQLSPALSTELLDEVLKGKCAYPHAVLPSVLRFL
jgi:hypothetical protein